MCVWGGRSGSLTSGRRSTGRRGRAAGRRRRRWVCSDTPPPWPLRGAAGLPELPSPRFRHGSPDAARLVTPKSRAGARAPPRGIPRGGAATPARCRGDGRGAGRLAPGPAGARRVVPRGECPPPLFPGTELSEAAERSSAAPASASSAGPGAGSRAHGLMALLYTRPHPPCKDRSRLCDRSLASRERLKGPLSGRETA